MSGKCITAANAGAAVVASTCTGKPNQRWKFGNGAGEAGSVVNGQIESIASPGMCVDDGDLPAPPGTTGNCAALIRGEGGDGPGVSLQSPNTGVCFPSQTAKPSESFSIVDGILKVGEDAECTWPCIRGFDALPLFPFRVQTPWRRVNPRTRPAAPAGRR